MSVNTPKTPNTPDPIDVKIEEGGKEMGTGLGKVISGACTTLCDTLSAGVHLLGAGVSKIQESLGDDKDQTLKQSRKNITDAHMKKAKKKGSSALKSAGKTVGGGWDTVKGTSKVAIHSVRKTVKDIRTSD